jgi:thymidine phosphorylase
MSVLNNSPDAPADLRARSLLLAGRVLEFDPRLRGGAGRARAQEILESGEALAAMERIIEAQGRAQPACPGALTTEIVAPKSGHVTGMDCFRLARIARLAGAPMDKGAGIDLFKKIGDPVTKGEPVYRIHSCFKSDFEFGKAMANENAGISIDAAPIKEGVRA